MVLIQISTRPRSELNQHKMIDKMRSILKTMDLKHWTVNQAGKGYVITRHDGASAPFTLPVLLREKRGYRSHELAFVKAVLSLKKINPRPTVTMPSDQLLAHLSEIEGGECP